MLSMKILLIFWVMAMIAIYIFGDRERQLAFREKYYTRIPAGYTPAEVSFLINYGKINLIDITATIIDLVKRGFLEFDLITFREIKLLVSRQEDFVISTTGLRDNLKPHEIFLIEWLINNIGDGKKVCVKDIRNSTRQAKNAVSFNAEYAKWCKAVVKTSNGNDFFKKKRITIVAGIFIGVCYFVLAIILHACSGKYYYLFLIALAAIMIVYIFNVYKRTQTGQEQYELWMAFKRFLKQPLDNTVDKEAVNDIMMFENYIPYAVSFGIYNGLLHSIPKLFTNDDIKNNSLSLLNKHSLEDIERFLDTLAKTLETSLLASEKAKMMKKQKENTE